MRLADIADLRRIVAPLVETTDSGETPRASYFNPRAELEHRYLFAEDHADMLHQLGILTPDLVLFCCADAECLHAPSAYFLVHFDLLGPLFRTYGRSGALSHAVWETVGFSNVGLDPEAALRGFLSLFAGAELGEQQIVFGADDRIEEALDAACSLGARSCLFHHCCIGKVTGVDWRGISRRVQQRTGVNIVHDANVGSDRFYSDVAARLDATHRQPPTKTPPRRFNLVGFRDEPGARELTAVLDLLGFELASQPVPDITVLDAPELRRAQFQVLNPVRQYDTVYDAVFRRLDTPVLEPQAPYGFIRSLRWVETIAQHGGVALDTHTSWLAYYERHLAVWTSLQDRARQHRVGLILSPADATLLLAEQDAPLILPIPLLSLLEEAGFGIDILLTAEADAPVSSASDADETPRHTVTLATAADQVDAWLAAPERQLVYSDLKRDHRLATRGAAPFSLLLVEPGFEGACRTLEHLVRLCEMTYFQDYQKHRQGPCAPLPT